MAKTTVIAFRTDASLEIGTGHVTRCLTLANMLRDLGVKSYFICRAHPGHLAEKIESEGHSVMLLPLEQQKLPATDENNDHEFVSWLGATLSRDIDETIQRLQDTTPSWIVIDHFSIDARWESKIRDLTGISIMVIDGLANREHECDLLLDQTFSTEGEKRWQSLVPPNCKLFVGPKFALLRPEFHTVHRTLRQRDGIVRRILIAFGGVDEPNATGVVLAAVNSLDRPDIAVDVVIGDTNPHYPTLKSRCQKLNNVQLHVQTSRIAELCAASDLAIGGGGTMTWERCFLGLPALIISIAENQIKPAEALESIGAAVYVGDISRINEKIIRKNIEKLINNQSKLKKIQIACEELMSESDLTIPQSLLKTA